MVGLIKKIFKALQNNKWWAVYTIFIVLITICFKHYRVIFNCTNSLSEKLFIVKVGDNELKHGDFVVAYSKGLPNMPDKMQLIKKVVGLPNQTISFIHNNLYIDGIFCCEAHDRKVIWGEVHPLTLRQMIIPTDCYFVKGTSNNSFDSRYKEFGFICKNQILGKAISLF